MKGFDGVVCSGAVMRILRVTQHLYPDVTGGMPYHVHALSRDQAAMGHEVTVVTIRHDEELLARETRAGYEVIRCDPVVSPLGNAFPPGVWRELRSRDDVDVVHAHSHQYLSTNMAALGRRLGGAPLAITNHGLYSQSAPEWLFGLYLRTLGRWTFNRADVVFCYTETERDRLRELGVSRPIEVVSNGIDRSRFSPNGSTSDVMDHNGPVVLFVGRLVEGKRPVVALEAMECVRESFPEAKLFVVGEGPLREDVEAAAAAVEGAVDFVGQVGYEDMPGLYRAADVLVLPSRAEGMPRVVMEATATGLPVVASDIGQLANARSDLVYSVGANDAQSYGTVVSEVLGKTVEFDRTNIVGADWSDTVSQTTDALERVCLTEK